MTPLLHHEEMNERFRRVLRIASTQHSVISSEQLTNIGVSASLRHQWVVDGALEKVGARAFSIGGSTADWHQTLMGGWLNLEGYGAIGGRSAGRLHRLDSFSSDAKEYLVPREHRWLTAPGVVRSTSLPFQPGDLVTIDGMRCLSVERLIVEAATFGFSESELADAIDSGMRLRLVSETRLRARILAGSPAKGRKRLELVRALVDTGGESRLEREFLGLLRQGGIVRPETQRVFKDGGRTLARVDFFFGDHIVVEVAGHTTHSSRSHVQVDAERRTELTLRGLAVLTFTYDDVFKRPAWVLGRLRHALANAA